MTRVKLTDKAEKDLSHLDGPIRSRALRALMRLEREPYAGHALSGKLSGARSVEFSAPGGAYRAAYVTDEQNCVVFLVGSHENFYDLAERRFKALRKRDDV